MRGEARRGERRRGRAATYISGRGGALRGGGGKAAAAWTESWSDSATVRDRSGLCPELGDERRGLAGPWPGWLG